MQFMKKTFTTLLAFSFIAGQASAHGRWVVPSHTILSGSAAEHVTFDISISNDIFYPDYALGGLPVEKTMDEEAADRKLPPPIKQVMASSRLLLTKPDGSSQDDSPLIDFYRKSVGVALIDQDGTYRISLTQSPIYFTWFNNTDDSPNRVFGKQEQVMNMLPEGAKDVRCTKLVNTVETFITRNNVSQTVLKSKGKGLEIEYLSHPNELFVGESLTMKVMFNGKALEGVSAHLVRNNTRYRNDREDISVTSNNLGEMTVRWEKPGMYMLEIEYEQDSNEPGIASETFANYIVFEVFPQ